MDVLYVLRSQHDELRQISLGLLGDSGKALGFLARLSAYVNASAESLYAELADLVIGGELLVGEAEKLRLEVFKFSKTIEKEAKKGALSEQKIAGLKEVLERYFQFEEQVVMPKLRSAVRTEEREDLGQLLLDGVSDALEVVTGKSSHREEFRV